MDRGGEYEFMIAERLSPMVVAAFDELSVNYRDGVGTLLSGTVRDQSHLHGVLARFQMLGLTLEGLTKLRGSGCRGSGSLEHDHGDSTADRGGGTLNDERDAEDRVEVPRRRDGLREADQQSE